MKEAQPRRYKVEPGFGIKDQIESIKTTSKKTGHLARFIEILEEAVRRLEADPHGWGDPEYRAKTVDAVAYRAILRPVVFRYVVYEQFSVVVLLNVRLFAEFD